MFKFISLILRLFFYTVQGFLGLLWGLIKRKDPPNFSCDIVLITGGAQGLGRELALLFSSAGATIVLWDINQEKLRETVSEITARGCEAFGYVVDVSKREEIEEGAERVREEVGNVSVLVNNAGVLPGKLIKEFKEGEFEKTITVNFLSHYWTIKSFLPWMIENDYGHIVEIASFASFTGGPLVSDYNSSKAAVYNFSESLHFELQLTGKKGVKVTCVCPWEIDTGLAPGRVKDFFSGAGIKKLSVGYVAAETLAAVCEGKFMIMLPKRYVISALLSFLSPRKIKDTVVCTYGHLKEEEEEEGKENEEELTNVVHYKKS